jgi:hypothetical protein
MYKGKLGGNSSFCLVSVNPGILAIFFRDRNTILGFEVVILGLNPEFRRLFGLIAQILSMFAKKTMFYSIAITFFQHSK